MGEKLQLEVHLAMCRGCTNFREQMNFLRMACRRFMQRQGGGDDGSSS